jgi:hypothetical protein
VGLSAKELPELAIYGLPTRVAHSLLNELARRMVAAGTGLATGEVIEGVLEGDVPLIAVAMSDARDLNLVRELYGAVASAVQVVWPDADGLWPWEPGSAVLADEQPMRGRPPAARPVYRAHRIPGASAAELSEWIADQPRRQFLTSREVDHQADNNIRAGWAARALVAYAEHLGGNNLTEEVETAAKDLLSDLRHLFDALGVDWQTALSSVEANYRREILGEL